MFAYVIIILKAVHLYSVDVNSSMHTQVEGNAMTVYGFIINHSCVVN